ncbi:MAG: Asp23/Gls24 family envelope stress response protein [Clostridia bacterium]|jgi:hypothetical protein|nr:Asp23/Gls24 family envelope stress response protein [Clostridium sp.]MEE0127071.1 Asp23/Gls24 family envelope stress response protein [Clostridia bacterium]HJJ12969.1 Asp23/Gls24 family envelope stress response protein [Clostridiaceae bacterium]
MEENKEKVSLVENILNEEEDNINISEEVITTISGIAVSEISGVAEMAGGITGGITEVLSGKKNLSKGIKADVAGNNVKIDVNIIVNYGVRIPDVAFDIQNKVKQTVENMTGLKVNEVNVHVQGVNVEKTKEEE